MRTIGPQVDNELMRRVRRELNRRYSVDCSRVQVRVSYGVVYLTGEIRGTRGMEGSVKEELETIRNILLHISGVREIVDNQLHVL